jgi:hypothetical protein
MEYSRCEVVASTQLLPASKCATHASTMSRHSTSSSRVCLTSSRYLYMSWAVRTHFSTWT